MLQVYRLPSDSALVPKNQSRFSLACYQKIKTLNQRGAPSLYQGEPWLNAPSLNQGEPWLNAPSLNQGEPWLNAPSLNQRGPMAQRTFHKYASAKYHSYQYTTGHKRIFLPTASHLWNELPEEIVAIRERDMFKTEVNTLLDALRHPIVESEERQLLCPERSTR